MIVGVKNLNFVLKLVPEGRWWDYRMYLIHPLKLWNGVETYVLMMVSPSPPAGPALHMATVDIKNPEINNVRFHNSHSHQQPYHLNNMLSHSGLNRKDKKTKGKKKKLTKADIGTPSNFQWVTPRVFNMTECFNSAADWRWDAVSSRIRHSDMYSFWSDSYFLIYLIKKKGFFKKFLLKPSHIFKCFVFSKTQRYKEKTHSTEKSVVWEIWLKDLLVM